MWKLLSGLSLSVCLSAVADGAPPKPSVMVQTCGKLRHGMMAIGGETTGTTITFNHMVWELQLGNDAAREFAKEHHKKPVVVTGALRRISSPEIKTRWIIDVSKLTEPDKRKDKEGTRIAVEGTLQAGNPRGGHSAKMTISADDQVWSLDLTADADLQRQADALVGQAVFLMGRLQPAPETNPREPVTIQVSTLKPPESDAH